MATGNSGTQFSEDEVVRLVRWRFRICRYLFIAAAGWIVIGAIALLLSIAFNGDKSQRGIALATYLVGMGIFSVAAAITQAIYRCPVCDSFIRRFRPRKEFCQSCGARIRAARTDSLEQAPQSSVAK